jgi:hypothetical protein
MAKVNEDNELVMSLVRQHNVCVVCADQFGSKQELDRHILDKKHQFSLKPSRNYPIGCEKCQIFFLDNAQLMSHTSRHSVFSTGQFSTQSETATATATPKSKTINITTATPPIVRPVAVKDNSHLECMVCGKVFPKGPGDLLRHTTAVTLKHLVSKKKSTTQSHDCSRCGLYFSSPEHLHLHQNQTSCRDPNRPSMALTPKVASTTAAVEQHANNSTVNGANISAGQKHGRVGPLSANSAANSAAEWAGSPIESGTVTSNSRHSKRSRVIIPDGEI